MIVLDPQILILKKLLLPGTNPKIDRETDGEFNLRTFSERLNLKRKKKLKVKNKKKHTKKQKNIRKKENEENKKTQLKRPEANRKET